MEKINLNEYLAANEYPGRGIAVAKAPDGRQMFIGYFIMGRSENSRNRVFDPVPERGGICTMADQRGYDMLLCYASSTEYTQLQRQLASHKVDGVILTYAMADDPCVDLLRQYDVPFVLIGRSEDKTIPQADNDQVTAACEMTRILLQMGAKRIALLVGSTIYAVNTDRTRGYLRGFAESCVPVDQRLVHSGIESAGQTIDALEAALEQKADCLLCGDDEIAYEVMRELRNRHILVPL